MTTILNFKDIVDLPKWRNASISINNVQGPNFFAYDLRNNSDRHPYIYNYETNALASAYNVNTDEWVSLATIGITTPTAGAFMPAQGPRGTLAAGSTANTVVLSTALPATVGVNSLANRGDGRGFKIRIIGNSAGSSGKTEERIIIDNTGQTTTPTIRVNTPFSFVPASGDTYEILSGRIFILGSTTAAGNWRYYDICTNFISAGLTSPAAVSTTDNTLLGLDELHVPFNRNPGEGFLGVLTATASGATSLTGQAVDGDSSVLADEYRNFQIRIVTDTGTPTAAGQRRNITTHTAGPSPVYTVPAWSVQPSANAIYVIENNGDRILLWNPSLTAVTATYQIISNAWSNVLFAARPASPSVGVNSFQSFGIIPDTDKNSRHSFIFSFRGNSTTLDLFDIAGSATGTWTGAITYGNSGGMTTQTGVDVAYDPVTMEGKYFYLVQDSLVASQMRTSRFDMKNRVLETYSHLRFSPSLLQTLGGSRAATMHFEDGNIKLSFLMFRQSVVQYNFILPLTV